MGSSCSSRQSGKDSLSEESDDTQNEQTETALATQNRDEEKSSVGEKGKIRDRTALRLIESDFSSCGDEGATVGTPLSSSMSASAANGSTKGKPPEKDEEKISEEIPDLSLLKEETRVLLEGKILEGRKLRTGNKICVLILGRLDDTGKRTKEMMNTLNKDIVAQMDEKGIEVVVINPHQGVPLLRVSHSPADLISEYLRGQRGVASFLIFILRGTNAELYELPTSFSDADFSQIVDALTNNGDKELLEKWFVKDLINTSSRRLKPPQSVFEGLLSEGEEFDKASEDWYLEYKKILAVLTEGGSGGSKDEIKFKLKKIIEKDLEWIKDIQNEIPLKVFLVRKDSKKPLSEDKMEDFLRNTGNSEAVEEAMKQILRDPRAAFDILRPKISADEGSEDWWNEIVSAIKSIVKDCIATSLPSERKRIRLLEDGVKAKLLREISCHHNHALVNHHEKHHGLDEYLNQIHKYLTSPLRKALLISGPSGSGKTYLTTVAAAQCSKWSPNACVMIRFASLTDNSTTVEGLLYYLVEQTIVTHGHSPSYTCTEMSSTLQKLWQKATSNRPIIVFIDDLHQLINVDKSELELLNLVTELPEHVKVILTTHEQSSFQEEFSKRVRSEECFLEIENPSDQNCEKLLKDFMLNNKQSLTKSVWEKVQKNYQSSVAPLYLLILSQLFFMGAKDDENFGSNLEEEVEYFCKKLRTLYPSRVLEDVLGCLSLARIGLLEYEILSIIKSTQSLSSDNCILDWLCLQRILSPLLIMRRESGLVLISFSSPSIRKSVAKCFLENEDQINRCSEIFRKNVFRKEENRTLEISLSEEQKGSLSHLRALHDSSLLLEKKGDEGKTLFNLSWLFKMVEASGPFKVLEQIDLALEKTAAQNLELLILREVIQLSSSSVVYDSSQFFSQVYGRLKWRLSNEGNCARLSALLTSASESPLPCLLPLSPCLTGVRQDKSAPKDEDKTTYIDSVFRIPGNPHHIIAISSQRSQVTVWNIFTMEIVRTLSGINQPRKLEMIDDYKCLLLCGRELRIYNLNEGTFLMKLREVMNQKMPFFGLHNSDHVVALSRSRMYVNMMNLTEGNCVTTFKVGEDRFLNSLLVSENGKICVCGDDSQKPSALLVWDLQLRKLMYDLRIPHHEFATRLAAITTEGHYVCCVCKEVNEPAPNFIVVYDLQSGTLFKRWKPETNTISTAISTAGTCVIVGLENSSVMAFDLITGNRRWTVLGHSSPPDTFRLDQQGLVLLSYDSRGKDRSIRVWDVPTGKGLATLTPDQKISACEITCDGKAVVLALEGLDAIFTFLLLHQEDPAKITAKSTPYGDDEHKGKIADFSQT